MIKPRSPTCGPPELQIPASPDSHRLGIKDAASSERQQWGILTDVIGKRAETPLKGGFGYRGCGPRGTTLDHPTLQETQGGHTAYRDMSSQSWRREMRPQGPEWREVTAGAGVEGDRPLFLPTSSHTCTLGHTERACVFNV